MLTGGARDLPWRQQTLRSTFQWSYDLLNADEQRVFRWLAIFVGGCTLEAAVKLTGQQTSLDHLDSLVNKSLLGQHETDHSPRLSMLETIREFGLEQLNHTYELESAQQAHATYYVAFAEDAERELTGADQKSWLPRLEREQDNLRAALRWAIEHHAVDMAQRMAGALQPFWFRRGHWSEGRRWLEESLAMDSGAVQNQFIRAKALFAAGMLARFQGAFARRACCASRASHPIAPWPIRRAYSQAGLPFEVRIKRINTYAYMGMVPKDAPPEAVMKAMGALNRAAPGVFNDSSPIGSKNSCQR